LENLAVCLETGMGHLKEADQVQDAIPVEVLCVLAASVHFGRRPTATESHRFLVDLSVRVEVGSRKDHHGDQSLGFRVEPIGIFFGLDLDLNVEWGPSRCLCLLRKVIRVAYGSERRGRRREDHCGEANCPELRHG